MNWFDAGGADYAAHRPDYPPELVRVLAGLAPGRRCAVDVGCGTGQLTALLAGAFDRVIGVDPSADQIAHATAAPGVAYRVGDAAATGLPAHCADLITVAQAAHWFDLPAFYAEAARIATAGALLALITYGAPELDPAVAARFSRFYTDEIGPYWPPERRHVDDGYARLDFPFPPVPVAVPPIERWWTLDQLTGYLQTWSAVRRAERDGAAGRVSALADDLRPVWGDGARRMSWPITVRAGRIGRAR